MCNKIFVDITKRVTGLVSTLLFTLFIIVPNSSFAANDTTRQASQTPGHSAIFDQAAMQDSMMNDDMEIEEMLGEMPEQPVGFYDQLKTKFIEGGAAFMSIIALVLILGLALSTERILYLNLCDIDTQKFKKDMTEKLKAGDRAGALEIANATRGPSARLAEYALSRTERRAEDLERVLSAVGGNMATRLERGFSWLSLFIAMAPSLGFLGTVIGMVMSFDRIEQAGDISPTIVASGMKVALITTIFGIVVALVLQIFYNYVMILADKVRNQMNEVLVCMVDNLKSE